MDGGLGPNPNAIIERGRTGQSVSPKPLDRRAIIEEAAGVTRFKTKKRLAAAKLESAKLNLARVNDILVEVEKQLASLKRQAGKARRYAEIREQMRSLLRQVLASKAQELDAEAERLDHLLREIATSETRQVAALEQMETDQERLSARTYELDSELRQNQNLLGQTALELDRSENRIGFNRQRGQELALLHGKQAQAEQALAHYAEAQARLEASEKQLLEESLEYRERADATAFGWQAAVDRARALEQSVRGGQARVAELRREQQETQARFDAARDALAGARARRASLEQILNDRSYTADAVQKLFASNGENSSRGFALSGSWPTTPKWKSSTKVPWSSSCARNLNTSWWKPLTTRARESPCCAKKSVGAQRFSSIPCTT